MTRPGKAPLPLRNSHPGYGSPGESTHIRPPDILCPRGTQGFGNLPKDRLGLGETTYTSLLCAQTGFYFLIPVSIYLFRPLPPPPYKHIIPHDKSDIDASINSRIDLTLGHYLHSISPYQGIVPLGTCTISLTWYHDYRRHRSVQRWYTICETFKSSQRPLIFEQ